MLKDAQLQAEKRAYYQLLRKLLSDELEGELVDYTYLVAGPPAMVEGVTGQLSAAGVPEERVLPDRFSGY